MLGIHWSSPTNKLQSVQGLQQEEEVGKSYSVKTVGGCSVFCGHPYPPHKTEKICIYRVGGIPTRMAVHQIYPHVASGVPASLRNNISGSIWGCLRKVEWGKFIWAVSKGSIDRASVIAHDLFYGLWPKFLFDWLIDSIFVLPIPQMGSGQISMLVTIQSNISCNSKIHWWHQTV